MKIAVLVAGMMLASPVYAQSAYDGTWKVDVSSAKLSTKPDVWMIKDGTYSCSTCTPAVKTPADGKVHPVSGHDYYDAMSVTVVDSATIHYVYMRGGKTVTDSTDTIGTGGSTINSKWSTSDNAKGETVTGKGVMKRVAAGPAGAHATSGGWIRTNDVQLSDKVLSLTLKMVGNELTMMQPTGETYTAKIGGPKVPLIGDPAKTMVAVTKTGNTLIETDYRNGKAVNRFTMTPMANGTMHFVATDLKLNATSEFTGKKI